MIPSKGGCFELTVGGKSQSAPLELMLDPRVKNAPGLAAKFALSMEVYHDQDALHRAVNDIRDAKNLVANTHKNHANDKALLARGDAIAKQSGDAQIFAHAHFKYQALLLAVFRDKADTDIRAHGIRRHSIRRVPCGTGRRRRRTQRPHR